MRVRRQPLAITREVGLDLAACQLTHQTRVPIDLELAGTQHRAYERALANAGYAIERLRTDRGMPDAVFIEDIAVVFDDLAIVTRPGAESRRPEAPAVAAALQAYRPVEFIASPGTVDGGDVLVIGRRVFVGRSTRTNDEGITQIRRLLTPHGYAVCQVAVPSCLHLKSAVTLIDERLLLANPAWVDLTAFSGLDCVEVDPAEPSAANALRLPDCVLFPSAFPRTAERLRAQGLRVYTIDTSELAKAEGAVTCCSLLVPTRPA